MVLLVIAFRALLGERGNNFSNPVPDPVLSYSPKPREFPLSPEPFGGSTARNWPSPAAGRVTSHSRTSFPFKCSHFTNFLCLLNSSFTQVFYYMPDLSQAPAYHTLSLAFLTKMFEAEIFRAQYLHGHSNMTF